MTETTPLLRNLAKEKLARGETVYSMTVRLVRTVDIAAIAHTAGFDSLYIDMEHSSFPLEAAGQICLACNFLGITPLVRVPGPDPAFIARVLDSGAMGIIVPDVQTAAAATAVVDAVKHAPRGSRSLAGAPPQLNYRAYAPDRVVAALDDTSMVVVMVESRAGVDAIEEIAGVQGVDMVLVGANDLSVDLGIAGQMDDPRIHDSFVRVIDACTAAGVAIGIGGLAGWPDLVRAYVELGARYVSTGNDISFLSAAAAQKRKMLG